MARIAIPSMSEQGLESDVSAHFGSCRYFTLVDMSDGKIENVSSIDNGSHEGEHNCAAPAMLLGANNVDVVLVSGIGGRPLVFLMNKGIKVFSGAFGHVSDAIKDYNEGMLDELTDRGTCNCSH